MFGLLAGYGDWLRRNWIWVFIRETGGEEIRRTEAGSDSVGERNDALLICWEILRMTRGERDAREEIAVVHRMG